MRAAVLEEYNTPLKVITMADPVPGPDEVIIKVGACGICGSDRFLQKGGFNSSLPIVPGHEAAGEVVEVGSDVTNVRSGDRVALYYIEHCGKCRYCLSGKENICPSCKRMGVDFNGAMAELVKLSAQNIIPIDDGLDLPSAAVITDAVGTPLHALKIAELQAGDTVLILGIGGIGSNAVQLAKVLGANVIAASRSDQALQTAQLNGADFCIKADENLLHAVHDITNGLGVNVCLQCAPSGKAYESALSVLAPGGKLIIVGTATQPVPFPTNEILWAELQIRGSRGFTKEDIGEALRLVQQGKISVNYMTQTQLQLSEVNEALANLDDPNVVRSILVF